MAPLDVPGREGDFARLLEVCANAAGEPARGQIVFVAGDAGSGRSALLRALAADLRAAVPRPILLAGGFVDGRFVAWDEEGPPAEKVAAVVANVVTPAQLLVPYLALLGQVLSKGEAPLELVRAQFEQSERVAPTEFLSRLLRELCRESPVVCIVDDADAAPDGLWGDIVLALGEDALGDLPLVLVLAQEGPPELGRHDDDERDSLYVARRLCGRGHARWHPLAPLEIDDVGRRFGATEPDVAQRLVDVTGGRAGWAAQLWEHWRATGVVIGDGDGDAEPAWRFAPQARERTLDPVGDVLGRRLELLCAGDGGAAQRARELLVCAALEGRTFTAEAVARALGRESDEVIDLLDDHLVHDDEHPDGLVLELGSVGIDDGRGTRHLWLYRFESALHWLTLCHHHDLPEERRRELARALAASLTALYGERTTRVTAVLARLWHIAGDEGSALRLRQVADAGASREVILWRAQALLEGPDPDERADRRRASQLLIAAADELVRAGSSEDGLRLAQAAYRLAPLRRDRAEALYLTGVHQLRVGSIEHARIQLSLALELRRKLGDRLGEARAGHALAVALSRKGANDEACAELDRALGVLRELGDRAGEADVRHSLANAALERGAHDETREHLSRALELLSELDDRRGEADTRLRIARLDMEQGALAGAREELTRALELYREIGDRRGEADARHNMARIDAEEGAHEEARRALIHVLDVYRELGDAHGEAATRHALAGIAAQQGEVRQARRQLQRVLELGRQLADDGIVAAATDGLAVLDGAPQA